jgi:DNA-binding transcriptional LysR family regulator
VRSGLAGGGERLRVGASTTPGLYHLPAVLRGFRLRHPGVELSFCIENSVGIESKLIRNDLDLAFVGIPLKAAGLRSRQVADDELVCYAAATHPLARQAATPRALAAETCITREPGSATRGLMERCLRRARVRPARTIEITGPEAAKVLVRAGLGFAYTSRAGLRGPLGAGLRELAIPGLRVARPIHLVLHAGKRLSPAMRAFVDLATGELQRGEAAPRRDPATAL